MPVVNVNGKRVNFPEGTSPEVMQAALAQFAPRADGAPSLPGEPSYDNTQTPEPSMLDSAKKYGSNVVKSLESMRNMSPVDILRGTAGAGLSALRGAVATPLGSATGALLGFGKSPQEQEQIAQFAQEKIAGQTDPNSNTGKVQGMVGAMAAPATRFLSESGAGEALLPLAPEMNFSDMTAPLKPYAQKQLGVYKPRTAEEALLHNMPADSAGAMRAPMDLTGVPDELREAILKQGRRGPLNMEAVNRHIAASRLPSPVALTAGQATGAPSLLSQEQNLRGAVPQFAQRFNEQNRALNASLEGVRERAGPEVFSTNATEHGDTLLGAYQQMDAARKADISSKYRALADANGGQLPLDPKQFLHDASQELVRNFKADFVPPNIAKLMERAASQPTMTIENFENLRTTLATEARSLANARDKGNELHAVRIIRDALESTPIPAGATAEVKALADSARQASRERFAAIEADPAYHAAVNETVAPDDFTRRFVTGGKRDDLGQMQRNIGSNDPARQTVGVSALDFLRESAALNPAYQGNFAAHRFNKALQGLEPKAQHLFAPQDLETLRNLGEAATSTTFQPRGSSVNNSNTATAMLAEQAGNYLGDAAEGVANNATLGIPFYTWGKAAVNQLRYGRKAKRALEPGAGISYVRPLDEEPY